MSNEIDNTVVEDFEAMTLENETNEINEENTSDKSKRIKKSSEFYIDDKIDLSDLIEYLSSINDHTNQLINVYLANLNEIQTQRVIKKNYFETIKKFNDIYLYTFSVLYNNIQWFMHNAVTYSELMSAPVYLIYKNKDIFKNIKYEPVYDNSEFIENNKKNPLFTYSDFLYGEKAVNVGNVEIPKIISLEITKKLFSDEYLDDNGEKINNIINTKIGEKSFKEFLMQNPEVLQSNFLHASIVQKGEEINKQNYMMIHISNIYLMWVMYIVNIELLSHVTKSDKISSLTPELKTIIQKEQEKFKTINNYSNSVIEGKFFEFLKKISEKKVNKKTISSNTKINKINSSTANEDLDRVTQAMDINMDKFIINDMISELKEKKQNDFNIDLDIDTDTDTQTQVENLNENQVNETQINENQINENQINENQINENQINETQINETQINEIHVNEAQEAQEIESKIIENNSEHNLDIDF